MWTRRRVALILIALAALDACVLGVALIWPNPFGGFGVVAIAILPILLAYYGTIVLAVGAGIPLAIACFWSRNSIAFLLGLALAILTVANVPPIVKTYRELTTGYVPDPVYAAAVADCITAMQGHFDGVNAYFAEPRKPVALTKEFQVSFENGVRVDIPRQGTPEAFGRFFLERLSGSEVQVTLQALTDADKHWRCQSTGSMKQAVEFFPYAGVLSLDGKRIDQSTDLDRDFALPVSPSTVANGEARVVVRWFDAHSGDRTYSGKGVAGYVSEDRQFLVRVRPGPQSRALYLCNVPLTRPDSPEHFVSTDPGCEGQQEQGLVGYIGSSRDVDTPWPLYRCQRIVQSPLRTGYRHLITTASPECLPGTPSVIGFVPG